MNIRYILFLLIGFDALWLVLQINELSISYNEAEILSGSFSFLQLLIKSSIALFGQNDFALRFPMILLHIASAFLLYILSKEYVKLYKNRAWLLLIFILLPGVISSAIIVNSAGLILFGVFLFVYVYKNYAPGYSYALLLCYLFLDGGFVTLFLALIFYALFKKEYRFFVFNILLFFFSLLFYGIDTHGTPKGYFLDSIGIYAAIFSPIIFIYLVYVLYRRYLTKDLDILWFIAAVALVFSLLLSFRQRIAIELFAPFVIVSLPLMAQTFEHSYRVRLNIFRKRYRFAFVFSLVILLANSSVVFFNKYLYYFIEEPKKHFSYKLHIAKELAKELKNREITCIKSEEKMAKRLAFYGVTNCNKYLLTSKPLKESIENSVTISYKNRVAYFAYVSKINKN